MPRSKKNLQIVYFDQKPLMDGGLAGPMNIDLFSNGMELPSGIMNVGRCRRMEFDIRVLCFRLELPRF